MSEPCWCEQCGNYNGPFGRTQMILCPVCGNKRCPRANSHENECTGSNEPGQPGSSYPAFNPLDHEQTR